MVKERRGTVEGIDDGYRVRMARGLEHAPSAVWRMLTEAEAVARWLAPGAVDPVVGGRARINCSDRGTPVDSAVE